MAEVTTSTGHVVYVDEADLPEVSRHSWTYIPASNGKGGYAARWVNANGRRKPLYMHRQLMGDPPGIEIDHRDGNGLNNRRTNMRQATRNTNNVNRDGKNKYRGVYWCRGAWKAQAKAYGRCVHLGTFKNPIEAARAYNVFALATWGEFARLNDV